MSLSLLGFFSCCITCVVSESIHTPQWKVTGNSLGSGRGGAGLKAKPLEEKCEAKLEFPGGRGVQNKKPSMEGGGYGYFLELHITLVKEATKD